MTDEAFASLADRAREQIRAEERERIAQWCDERAKSSERVVDLITQGARYDFSRVDERARTYREAAREIRDGAHHEGQK